MKLYFLNIFFIILSSVAIAENSKPIEKSDFMDLDSYLAQVRHKHDGFKSAEYNKDSAPLIKREAELLTSPNLFSSALYISDSKQSPFFPYQKFESTQLQVGIQEQTKFGTLAKLYYSYSSLRYVGTAIPLDYQTSPLLEFTQSLWRNGFGSEISAMKQQIESNLEAQRFAESFRLKSYLFEAESSYWRLALSREATQVSKDAFDRAKRIFDYLQKKSKQGLADQSDFLQAKAALEARRLDHRISQEDEQRAARSFNSGRGIDSDLVAEKLLSLSSFTSKDIQQKLKRQNSMQTRDDVRAAQEQAKASIAGAKISQEKDKPILEIFGQFGLNGFDTSQSASFEQSFGTSKPTETIGIRLNFPLNASATRDAATGWREQQIATQHNLERKIFEQERDWHELNEHFENALVRFDMLESLSNAQNAKLQNERSRHSKGRTTLVNVIMFELDFMVAELSRLRTLAEVLQIHAQLKLFGDNYESR